LTPITPPKAETGSAASAGRRAAGIGVLDDGDEGACGIELARELPAGVEIDQVVVAQLFSLQLARAGNAGARAVNIERRLLVRVLAVA
jgi:hypothetical protein